MICKRPDCQRPIKRAETCCSSACKSVWLQLEAARNLLDHLGASGPVDSFVRAAGDLNSALTETYARRSELQALAISASWSVEDFERLCRGELSGTADPGPVADPCPSLGAI
jgi:hypothetical protein